MEIVARARLRPEKDKDLINAFEQLPKHKDKSDVVRDALRLLFFGNNSNNKYIINDNEIVESSESIETELVSDEEVDKSIDEFLLGI